MQSVCSVLPMEPWSKVIDARALLAEDPALGRIYDPPFVHFTHQLAGEYDWEGLEPALAGFAVQHRPFEVRTTGLHVFSGGDAGIVVAVFRSPELVEYHRSLWDVISPYADGAVPASYEPASWVPHVTVKRCGQHWDSFGRAMAKLAQHNFAWTFTIDNISVQCDPGQNSLTHYQRLWYALGDDPVVPARPGSNATVIDVIAPAESDPAPNWRVLVRQDDGVELAPEWSAPDYVRVMAAAKCSTVHFAGGRCTVLDGRVVAVEPNTQFPIAG